MFSQVNSPGLALPGPPLQPVRLAALPSAGGAGLIDATSKAGRV
jgi:hypothetical protein